jgi:hypothetical protein
LKEFVAPKSAADLCDLLAESIIEIRAGKLDPKVGNVLGYLGTSLLRALGVSDIERRLDVLEGQHRKMEDMVFQSNDPGLRTMRPEKDNDGINSRAITAVRE